MLAQRLKQRIFDRVARHLLTQRATSIMQTYRMGKSSPQCLYRGSNGLKCAVGCLIPDSRYDPFIEKMGAGDIPVLKAIFPRNWDRARSLGIDKFLTDLQIIHDDVSPESWERALQRFANEHDLRFHLTSPARSR